MSKSRYISLLLAVLLVTVPGLMVGQRLSEGYYRIQLSSGGYLWPSSTTTAEGNIPQTGAVPSLRLTTYSGIGSETATYTGAQWYDFDPSYSIWRVLPGTITGTYAFYNFALGKYITYPSGIGSTSTNDPTALFSLESTLSSNCNFSIVNGRIYPSSLVPVGGQTYSMTAYDGHFLSYLSGVNNHGQPDNSWKRGLILVGDSQTGDKWTMTGVDSQEPNVAIQGVSGSTCTVVITPNETFSDGHQKIGYYTSSNSTWTYVPVGESVQSVTVSGVTSGTTIYAKAVIVGFDPNTDLIESNVISKLITFDVNTTEIHLSSEINTDINASYTLASDFKIDATVGTADKPFKGTIDGLLNPISMNSSGIPFIAYAEDAVIKNVIISDVKTINVASTSYGGNAGAICCNALGATRIYNCGVLAGSVGGSNYVGGLVGLLDGTSRVINCYSYADITSGSVKAGIVGYNNYASKYNDLKTMVMNCMFYGDIASGGIVAPIYGGLEISNDYDSKNSANLRLNNYNYFLYEAPFSTTKGVITDYNCALAAERRFLVRFEFYRHLLNSTRELAAWYATGVAEQGKMHKWVLDKTIAPYPILKEQGRYPSVVNYDPDYTYDVTTGAKISRSSVTTRNQGGTIKVNGMDQTLKIYVSNSKTDGGQTWPTDASVEEKFRPGNTGITVYRTDKDTANFNFNYDKVQLPYYNDVGSKNYTGNKVVTGWKIVSMQGGTAGGYTEENYDYPNYNYADRSHYGKDLYTVSHRVFSQGGYFNVSKGVTAITIEPYWGKAAYLSDARYDRYGYNTTDDLTIGGTGGLGVRYTEGGTLSINGDNTQKVHVTMAKALLDLTGVTNATVYDYAVVLVGNYHHHTTLGRNGLEISDGTTPFTMTSVDLNGDNEPDYCLIYRSGKQKPICPIRFDFITVPGMAMAHKMAQAHVASKDRDLGIPGNCTPKGWFEITTTGLIKYGQYEYSYNNKTLSPLIFMGGVIDQIVANNTVNGGSNENYNNKVSYMLFGDNVWFQMFSNGTHMDNKSPTPHRPVSMIGGEYEKVYLSGYFRPDANTCTTTGGDNNAECYIDGGRFGEVAGAGQELISGDVTWVIDHADITSFYGGGINSQEPITGNITTTINNSHVNYFCGGPKFGNMGSKKEVNTTADSTTFGKYFGAGYGGTSIYRECPSPTSTYNQYQEKNYNWNKWVSDTYDKTSTGYYRGKFTTGKGISCGYEHEFFAGSGGNVGRLFLQYASFSLAQTNNVRSTLTKCTVLENFYGGGSLGAVVGSVTSTLEDCTVLGSVFGAGYSVQIPKVGVLPTGGFINPPYYNESTGVYEKVDYRDTVEYKWVHVTGTIANGTQTLIDNEDIHTINTTEDLEALGTVNGTVTLTLKGSTTVGGNVFGGGDESAVTGANGHTIVNIQDDVEITGNVFGGGNEGNVSGNTQVNIKNPTTIP